MDCPCVLDRHLVACLQLQLRVSLRLLHLFSSFVFVFFNFQYYGQWLTELQIHVRMDRLCNRQGRGTDGIVEMGSRQLVASMRRQDLNAGSN